MDDSGVFVYGWKSIRIPIIDIFILCEFRLGTKW